MGNDFMDDTIDCLMTTICTDRPLPERIDDYRGELQSDGSGGCGRNDDLGLAGDVSGSGVDVDLVRDSAGVRRSRNGPALERDPRQQQQSPG